MKRKPLLLLLPLALFGLFLASCTGDEVSDQSYCPTLSVGNGEYCHLEDTSGDCPEDRPHRFDFDGRVLCSGVSEIPPEDREELEEELDQRDSQTNDSDTGVGDSDTGVGEDVDECVPQQCEAQYCGDFDDGCGGSLSCGSCGPGSLCGIDQPNRCTSHCDNGTVDGDETGVDCGGSCDPCENNSPCQINSDCQSGICDSDVCVPPLQWEQLPSLPTARAHLTATFGDDGLLYTAGGFTLNQGPSDRLEIYYPELNSWTTAEPLPSPRYNHSAAIGPDGNLWVMGGTVGADLGDVLDTVVIYDHEQDEWLQGPTLNTPRTSSAAATTADGELYVTGGRDDNGIRLDTVERYDPDTESWELLPSTLAIARHVHAMAPISNGRLYIFGGTAAGSGNTAQVEFLDPASGNWFTISQDMPLPIRAMGVATGADDRIWLLGGHHSPGDSQRDEVLIFDPEDESWSSGPTLIRGRRSAAATAGPDGDIYVLGGFSSDGISADITDSFEALRF